MRKLLISASLACGLLTSSCTTLTPGVDPITGGNIAAEITQVQALATQICAFEPTAQTIAAILSTFAPGVAPISAIVFQAANSICSAVSTKSYRRGAGLVKVRGVAIFGRFVR